MTDLTVVVPTFNGEQHLHATLDSLALQHRPVDVIVIDDGSTDGTVKVAEAHPLGARVVRQSNSGVAVARNRGLALASTRFVAFLDQDDLWHPDRSRQLLELADTTEAKAVATTERAFAVEADRAALAAVGDGRETWPEVWIPAGGESDLLTKPVAGGGEIEMLTVERFMQAPATVTTSLMYEREAAIAAGGCATFVRAADDHVLNVNMARVFGPIPRIGLASLLYRVHSASTTTVSPLVMPYLTTLLALRHGRALPSQPISSPYVDHLLWQMPHVGAAASWSERIGMLLLTADRRTWPRWLARWGKSRVRQPSR